jgi:hypothetical protein
MLLGGRLPADFALFVPSSLGIGALRTAKILFILFVLGSPWLGHQSVPSLGDRAPYKQARLEFLALFKKGCMAAATEWSSLPQPIGRLGSHTSGSCRDRPNLGTLTAFLSQ